MASVNDTLKLSVECVDDADGFPGVVIYDDKTFPISSEQGPAFVAGNGPHSSVRPFQFPQHEDEETAMEVDPPDLKDCDLLSINEEEEDTSNSEAAKY